jgi:hypothetical protein
MVPASPLEDSGMARSVSVGSLVFVDQAQSSSEREPQQSLACTSQAGEASQGVKVGCQPLALRMEFVEFNSATMSEKEHF